PATIGILDRIAAIDTGARAWRHLLQGRNDEAALEAVAALGADSKDALAARTAALALARTGGADDARRRALRAVELDEKDPESHAVLAYAGLRAARLDDPSALEAVAHDLEPALAAPDPLALVVRAWLALARSGPAAARPDLERAVERRPD